MKKLPWSYTHLDMYETCPAKLRFRIDIGRIGERRPQAQRGQDAHTTAEDYLKGKTVKLHECILPYKHVLAHVKSNDPFVEQKIAVTRDWKYTDWDSPDAWGRAVLDSAYIYGDRVEIQEWKTGRIYDSHDEQRKLYILFSMVKWPVAHDYQIQSYYFDLGKKKRLELTHADAKGIREDFNARIGIMARDDIMAPRSGPYCNYCEYSRTKGGPCPIA